MHSRFVESLSELLLCHYLLQVAQKQEQKAGGSTSSFVLHPPLTWLETAANPGRAVKAERSRCFLHQLRLLIARLLPSNSFQKNPVLPLLTPPSPPYPPSPSCLHLMGPLTDSWL